MTISYEQAKRVNPLNSECKALGGLKLVKVENFHLTERIKQDAESFRFAGQLGRFGLDGYFMTLASEGSIDIYASDDNEVELCSISEKIKQ